MALVALMAASVPAQTAANFLGPERSYIGSGNRYLDPLYKFALQMEQRVVGGGTGSTFYVDSNVVFEGNGTSWVTAKNTMTEAIALCTAARGDVICVAQGHQEVEAAAASLFDLNVAGVTILGCTNGATYAAVATGAATNSLMPTFILDHASATITVSAANCRISGVRIESDVIDCAVGLTATAAADGLVVDHCVFRDGAAAEELVIGLSLTADCDEVRVIANQFSTYAGGGCANAIVLAGGSDDSVFAGNTALGTYSAGAFLATAAASRNLQLYDNVFTNQGAIAVDLHASTTGIMARNYLAGTTSIAAALTDTDLMWLFENYVSGEDNKSGAIYPAADAD
jgi:hypothetical protein